MEMHSESQLRHAGVSEQQLPKLVEEHLERNRNVRQRQLRKKQGLPPIRKRRKASELVHVTNSRTSKVRAERRQQEQASRVDDGELGPGFAARKPPRCYPFPPHPPSRAVPSTPPHPSLPPFPLLHPPPRLAFLLVGQGI